MRWFAPGPVETACSVIATVISCAAVSVGRAAPADGAEEKGKDGAIV